MNRRGVALLTVLWVVALGSAMTASALGALRHSARVSWNRTAMLRAGWAREACLALVAARYQPRLPVAEIDSLSLGETWCSVSASDESAKLNVNRSDPAALRRFFGSDTLADNVLDWIDRDDEARRGGSEKAWYRQRGRPEPRNGDLAAVDELHLIRGLESIGSDLLRSNLTTDTDGRINVAAAAEPVLVAAFGEAIANVVAGARGGYLTSYSRRLLGELANRGVTVGETRGIGGQIVTEPTFVALEISSGVRGWPGRQTARVLVVPTGRRLATLRREVY